MSGHPLSSNFCPGKMITWNVRVSALILFSANWIFGIAFQFISLEPSPQRLDISFTFINASVAPTTNGRYQPSLNYSGLCLPVVLDNDVKITDLYYYYYFHKRTSIAFPGFHKAHLPEIELLIRFDGLQFETNAVNGLIVTHRFSNMEKLFHRQLQHANVRHKSLVW